jgi:hypothetical protein
MTQRSSLSVETHLARIAPQVKKKFDNLEACWWRFQLLTERQSGCWQHARKSIPCPGVRYNNRRPKFRARPLSAFADVDFHADGTATFEKNAGNLVIGQKFAARRTDYNPGSFGDFACSPIRIPRSVQVMGRNHCMSGKSAEARGQSIVGPLRCDDGTKPRITKTPLDILLGDS